MNNDLSPNQALFLWRMLAAETPAAREPTLSTALPKINIKTERTPLVDKGYLMQEKRGATTYLSLTDKAWAWAEVSVDVEFPSDDPAAQALQGLLRRLLQFLRQRELPLASLFINDRALGGAAEGNPSGAQKPEKKASKKKAGNEPSLKKASKKRPVKKASKKRPVKKTSSKKASPNQASVVESVVDVTTRVEQACLELANGRRLQRVRLSELRRRLGDVPRAELDQALLDLQDAGRAVLYRDDDTAALTAADHEAALIVGNAPRHLVYLEA